jgi:hypothetical protein
MGATTNDAKELVDQIIDQQQVLAAAQAKHAHLMLTFSNTRRALDHTRITSMRSDGTDPRYTPGEFAALEIGLAIKTNKHKITRTIGIARRLHDETPDAWDAWQAGHIDHDRAARINKALIRLTRDTSKQLLNALVVDVATHKTVELLGRWLNEFVARVEPDQTNDRMRRCLEDRYVSIRPDIDGISFLHAAIASADADAINQVLNALAALALPGDTRTFQQRRADACTELLLGKISNGCHVAWHDDPDEDEDEDGEDGEDGENRDEDDEYDEHEPQDHAEPADEPAATEDRDAEGATEPIQNTDQADDTESDETGPSAADPDPTVDPDTGEPAGAGTCTNTADRPWDTDDDWDLPASAFRPDPHAPAPDPIDATDETAATPNPYRTGRPVITPCPHDHQNRPIPATIGVIISAQSLFGFSNTPGQLTDRSTLIPADLIRDLAQQPGTLFYRLLTDDNGNLLYVAEMGRFPSRNWATPSTSATAPAAPRSAPPRPIDATTTVRMGVRHPGVAV